MNKIKSINDIWLKAAVLGCLWASSEIVLGSFLHNLKIPFRGDILTFIGIILLISAGQKWKDKGLFWRSGLICALMKTMSPSAVIFGPMIAIFFEAMLMEFAVRVFKRNIFAYLLGGVLAMSWTFFHKLFGFIIMYGFNAVELYTNLTKFAQKQFNFHFDNVWMPVIVLWCFYITVGLIAAITGIYIGRKKLISSVSIQGVDKSTIEQLQKKKIAIEFNYSLVWIAIIFIGVTVVLSLMNFSSWIYWVSAGIVLISVLVYRYRNALKPLKKPKFWLTFFIITILSGIAFAKMQNMKNGLFEGMLIGLQMNFRAIVMIVGFSALGKELCNPKISNFFVKTAFRQLPVALEVAFDTLPFVIANLPKVKDIFKSPVSIVQHLISQADFWLNRVTLKQKNKNNVTIITGGFGQGKSILLSEIVNSFNQKNIKVGGIISQSVIENNNRIGYDLINTTTKEIVAISRTTGDDSMIRVGRHYFFNEGIEFGKKALSFENNLNAKIIVVDEIGPWELENKGWAENVNLLIKTYDLPMIWVVRESLVNQVIENWFLENPLIINVSEKHNIDYANKILEFVKGIK